MKPQSVRISTLVALAAAGLAASTAHAATYLYNFHKYFDPNTGNAAIEIKPTSDGGYIMLGQMQLMALSPPLGRPWVTKLNSNFAVVWSTSYMIPGEIANPTLTTISAEDIWQTMDGGYIICGHHIEEFSNNDAAYLLRIDQFGNVIWYKTYPGIYNLTSVIELTDFSGASVFLACGVSYPTFGQMPTIMAADSAGNSLWVRYVAGMNSGSGMLMPGSYEQIIPYMVGPTGDMAAIVGNTNQYVSGCNAHHSDILVTVCDVYGNIFLNQVYGNGVIGVFPDDISTNETAKSIAWDQTTDKLTIAGRTEAYWMSVCMQSTLYDDHLVFQIDFSGSLLWANQYETGRPEGSNKIVINPSSPNQIWIAGWNNGNFLATTFSDDMVLLGLTHAGGVPNYHELYGASNYEAAVSLCLNATPGHVVVLGNTYGFKITQNTPYLVERFPNKARRCRDLRVAINQIPTWLPQQQPIELHVPPATTPLPLIDVDVTVADRTVCAKVEVTIKAVDSGGVGGGKDPTKYATP